MNWAAIGAFFANLLTKLAPLITAFLAGEQKQQSKQTIEELEAMRDAKAIRERIDTDPEYAKHVRDIFR